MEYGNNKKGVLVDVSAAVLDGDNSEFLPYFPNRFKLIIKNADSKETYLEENMEDEK